MVPEKQQPVEKKAYTKPQLPEVRLAAEEAVLGFCKFNNGNMAQCPGDSTCDLTGSAFIFIGLYCSKTCPKTKFIGSGILVCNWLGGRVGNMPRIHVSLSLSQSPPPQASYFVQIDPIPTEPSGQPVFFLENGWRLYQHQDRWIIWIRSQGLDHICRKFQPRLPLRRNLYIGKHPGSRQICIPPRPSAGRAAGNQSARQRLWDHAAFLRRDRPGRVESCLPGSAPAGKSTTARLWGGLCDARVLNDDHTIVRKINDEFCVYGTPWHGIAGTALAEDAPLKKIFILKHTPTNQAVRLPPAQAAAMLLVRAFAPLWSAPAMEFTLQFLDELCQASMLRAGVCAGPDRSGVRPMPVRN